MILDPFPLPSTIVGSCVNFSGKVRKVLLNYFVRLITFTVEVTSISFFRTLSALCFKSTLSAHEPTMPSTTI